MLCFRCEHRAEFLEGKRRPRYECGLVTQSKHTCYMFKPCKPVVLEKSDKKDFRPPLVGDLFSCRSKAVKLRDNVKLTINNLDDDTYVFEWKEVEDEEQDG